MVSAEGQMQSQFNLMPYPATVQVKTGQLDIDPSFSVSVTGQSDARLQAAVDRFLMNLRRETGMLPLDFSVVKGGSAKLVIQAEQATAPLPHLGDDESYALEISNSKAQLTAATSLGAMRGLETFLQLVENTPQGFAVPCLSIQDQPRFAWRGLMIDASRHFIPIEVVKRNLDAMEAVKLNLLHWHLSDNQGFRVESKKLPKLQELGSDGLYYTQAQVREIIDYASARGILVVPEFDMPGHSTAWFAAYPEIASGKGPYQIERRWGVFDPAMDPTREETYKFLDTLIGEMTALFPGEYFHIGGDEVNGKEWDANPKIQEFKRSHGLKTNDELQAYFTGRVQKIVRKHNKTMMGWDEVLQAEIPKDIVIHVWRDQATLAKAVKQGFRGVFSNGYYLDLMWPASKHYAVDPMSGDAASLTPEEQKRVLGGEGCMWAEYVSPENFDARVWPRMAAIAERLWSPQSVKDPASMYRRLDFVSQQLDWLGLTHNSSYPLMLRRIAGDDAASLGILAAVVEPVKNYTRSELAVTEPTSATPLNRLVDVARPESATERQFSELVQALIGGKLEPGMEARMRSLLMAWRDQKQSVSDASLLLSETVPLSQSLSDLGTAGLQALDYLDRREAPPASWTAEQLAVVREAKKPKAQLLLVVASSVESLIQFTAQQTVAK